MTKPVPLLLNPRVPLIKLGFSRAFSAIALEAWRTEFGGKELLLDDIAEAPFIASALRAAGIEYPSYRQTILPRERRALQRWLEHLGKTSRIVPVNDELGLRVTRSGDEDNPVYQVSAAKVTA